LVGNWLTAFFQEAVPYDRLPPRDELELAAGEGRFIFWIDEGRPVSMAAIARRLKDSATITSVYTPPELRRHGYAGSVTAATVKRIYAEGRKTACLYTNLRKVASNRCYVKIGFRPVSKSLHIHRILRVKYRALTRKNHIELAAAAFISSSPAIPGVHR
jgi:predicted GNAT family acetyltransferase